MSMVERVARAIELALNSLEAQRMTPEQFRLYLARAAIAAMREPTIEMQVAGTEQWLCEAAMEERSPANWRAMIDAALTD